MAGVHESSEQRKSQTFFETYTDKIMNTLHLESQARLIQRLERHPFRFAKTMPENPHWYTLRKEWDDLEFDDAVKNVRGYGKITWFQKYPYVGWNANGHYYWTMGAPIHETILINRKILSYESPYDHLAKEYDQRFHDPPDVLQEAVQFLNIQSDHSVLDVGCGTGVLHDVGIECAEYIGIDPSAQMLEVARAKHPDVDYRICALKDAYFWQRFDRIVLLFGVPNHIEKMYLERLCKFLKPGGIATLMWLNDQAGNHTVPYETSDIKLYPTPDRKMKSWNKRYMIKQIHAQNPSTGHSISAPEHHWGIFGIRPGGSERQVSMPY